MYRTYGPKTAPAFSALPPSLVVVCRERRALGIAPRLGLPASFYLLHPWSRAFWARFSPNIAPESGIFPERFLPRLFERTKADVIHRLAGRSGKLGEKIPGKTG